MIIKKELNVSGRKKVEILKDLKTKGFRAFPKDSKKTSGEENEQVDAEEEEEESASSGDNGYDYLLTVIFHRWLG